MTLLQRLQQNPALQLGLLLVVTGLLLASKLGNGFIYDDHAMIEAGDRIHDLANIPRFFANDTMWGSSSGATLESLRDLSRLDTWRPVTMTTFALDAQLSGREPWAYHLTNLLWHLVVTTLVYALGRAILRPREQAWATAGAAFFALHPALTEAHVWINGRSDLFAAVFGLAALLLSLHAGRASRPAAAVGLGLGAAVSLLLACLSKEVALMVTPLMPLAAWMATPTTTRDRLRAAALASIGPAVAGVAYLAARTAVLDGLKAGGDAVDLTSVLSHAPLLLLDGLRTTLVPSGIYFRYVYEAYAGLETAWLVAAALVAALLAAAAVALRQRAPALTWGLAGFALTLLPAVVIAVTPGWWGFDRYLYLPVALLAPGLAQLLAQLHEHLIAEQRTPAARALAVGLGLYLALEAAMTLLVIGDYHDELAFYQNIVAQAPEASHGHAGLGYQLLKARRFEEAAAELRTAVALRPDFPPARLNLLIALTTLGAMDEARPIAEESVQSWPDVLTFHHLLARTWMNDNPQLAAEILLVCLNAQPDNPAVLGDLRELTTTHPRRADVRDAIARMIQQERFAVAAPHVQPLLDSPSPP